MNILVTGSSGYIGKSFIETFKEKYTFSVFSLQNSSLESLSIKGIDTVLHCAALVHKKHETDYVKYYKINTEYTVNLAKKAKLNGVKHFIFISTIAVYGDSMDKVDEESECTPRTPYAKSKFEAEQKLNKLSDKEFKVSVIRPPMVYGASAPGNIVSLIKIIKIMPILPFYNTQNKRSFVYIRNLTAMIEMVVEKQKEGLFLASDDKSISTSKLIKLLSQGLESRVYMIRVPFFKMILKKVKPSLYQQLYGNFEVCNKYSQKILEYKNRYSVEEGLKATTMGMKV
ncbi:MAG: UDP-glucose 4-epimerase (EC [uncultured Sulfurovum sp.]|uniref:UDP-glucose 4-epimerase (EC) n=1 Tax=uncultured Sulfurovum sp. TaxID=269237 RepID=A0A6S6SZX0_9BACT|nr:MAG: UDP-glucose 4-epimerase (EC [uncultured Sulfurovum sp.]